MPRMFSHAGGFRSSPSIAWARRPKRLAPTVGHTQKAKRRTRQRRRGRKVTAAVGGPLAEGVDQRLGQRTCLNDTDLLTEHGPYRGFEGRP